MKAESMIVVILLCTINFSLGYVSSKSAFIVKKEYTIVKMAMDDFMQKKLDSIKRTFDALTERLTDPDVVNDRVQSLSISRERSAIEKTVEAYNGWIEMNNERHDLLSLEQMNDIDLELKEMSKLEGKELDEKMKILEDEITLMLLPRDPNDDRNVMLEVRAGTGGDEASIWAGDLVTMYKKYADSENWKVTPLSEAEGEFGGYKTCILQITGEYVYSKLKYEVWYLISNFIIYLNYCHHHCHRHHSFSFFELYL